MRRHDFVSASLLALGSILLATALFGQSAPGKSDQTAANRAATSGQRKASAESFAPALVASGKDLFLQDCAFCHGRDAGGGETGPDLTRSRLVAQDVNGSGIAPVIRNGRPGKGMPAFDLSGPQIAALVTFIHTERTAAEAGQKGGRRGVDVADLQTGSVEAGKAYFNGAGKCASCHSPSGDLAGIASRYQGLRLEIRMLYPGSASSKVSVTLPSGEVTTGALAYLDEFTVGLRDAAGYYRSWPVSDVKYTIDAPVEAHAELLGKYTDADVHNLLAYMQTLH